MRRTDQEFREELQRRQREYRARQKKHWRKILSTAGCIMLLILGGAMTLPLMPEMGAGSGNMAADYQRNEAAEAPMEAPAGVEGKADSTSYGSEAGWHLIPMVMIDGELYLDTGYVNEEVRKCGTPDGEITSAVPGSQTPTEDDQSNFGTGYSYQYGTQDGTVEIYMNGKWWIFATEEARDQILFPE